MSRSPMSQEAKRRISHGVAASLTARLASQGDWAERGLCRETDGDLWFPAQGDHKASQAAKEICGWCPVKAQCADWALTSREQHGIWGGLAPKDRERLRRAAA